MTRAFFRNGALAELVRPGKWRVQCGHCLELIGTMDTRTLHGAIKFGAANGGVLCPECRLGCCVECKTVLNKQAENRYIYLTRQGATNAVICGFCKWVKEGEEEAKEINREVVRQERSCSPCLVTHKFSVET